MNDPLGSSVVEKNNFYLNVSYSSISSQAKLLICPEERLVALKHLIKSTQTLMSRNIIIGMLLSMASNNNSTDLYDNLKIIGLTDIHKIVKLMLLVAEERVKIFINPISQSIYKNHRPQNLIFNKKSKITSLILEKLSFCIGVICYNDVASANAIINLCTKDLMHRALQQSSPGLLVTQTIINLITSNCFQNQNSSKENFAFQSVLSDSTLFRLLNALSAFISSVKVLEVDKEWAMLQVFKCLSNKIQSVRELPPEQTNFFNLSDISTYKKINLDGHENKICSLAYNQKENVLASAGYDGTVRIWCLNKDEPILEHTFVFHKASKVFGTDLDNIPIKYLSWSASGAYLAAAMEEVINIWAVSIYSSARNEPKKWFIKKEYTLVSSMCWPKYTHNEELVEYLLIGKIDGSVSFISVLGETIQESELIKLRQDFCK